MSFLVEHEPRPLTLVLPDGLRPVDLFVGSGGMALEVALLEADHEPTVGQMRELHRERLGRRVAPVLVLLCHKLPVPGAVGAAGGAVGQTGH
jgi:hypothetical protein